MKRQAPPLDAIEAFLIATRSPSFRAAAEKLALSPSAFSRRIQTLESFVGVALFDREGRQIELTESGRDYLAAIEPAVDAVRRITVSLRAERVAGPLRIMTPQSFAIAWLLPRVADLILLHPGIEPRISVGRDPAQLRKGLIDLAIVVRRDDDGDELTERLIGIEGMIVSAPVLANGREPPASLHDVADFPLLSVYRPDRLWQTWMKKVGYDLPPDIEVTNFTAAFMVYEAAAAGLGLAIGSSLIVDRFLAEGRLRPLFDLRAPIGSSYFLEYADETVKRRPDVRLFAAWLRTEVTNSATMIQLSDQTDNLGIVSPS